MKKIYISLILLFSTTILIAAEGDTTVVTSHNETHLETYTSYDAPISFPVGTNTYRKITMEFELGKYACPGYNPNNPGEGAGQTGWCGDWDYDVHILVCNASGDTVELGRMVTPYANSNMPRTPLTWKHSYLYDVTDYYPLLKNDATIRIFYAGWSGGFTGTVKFHFIEGTPPRDVVQIDPLWRGSFNYGNASDSIETSITNKTLSMPSNAVSAEMKLIITGHGGDNTENCAEFCKKWYQFKINDTVVEQKDIWRDDCGDNFLYPQSGTWVYDRGNWCPGDLVRTNSHIVPASATASPTFTVDLDFQNYYSSANQALYKIGSNMIFYAGFNRTIDVGIEEIISPNNEETFYRSNPICGEAKINIKNFGSTNVSSIEFEYGVEGQPLTTYTWSGNLASLKSAIVALPAGDLNTVSGSNQFVVNIIKVNGAADEDLFNNSMTATFTASPKWTGGNFYIDFKMSSDLQGHVNKANWNISDMDDHILFSRNGTVGLERYQDTVHLENGCYKLNVASTYIGYGFNFFNTFSSRGFLRVYDLATGNKLALPKTDLGNPNLEGNFGNGFQQYFTVTNSVPPSSVNDLNSNQFSLLVYPNPASDFLQISIVGHFNNKANISITNTLGQEVYSAQTNEKEIMIPTKHLANGIYTLNFESEGSRKIQKIIITH